MKPLGQYDSKKKELSIILFILKSVLAKQVFPDGLLHQMALIPQRYNLRGTLILENHLLN